MTNLNDGGPAFPSIHESKEEAKRVRVYWYVGMTLRDWFAGQALAGLCAKHGVTLPYQSRNTGNHDSDAAAQAYRYADAMLAERGKR